MRRSSKERLLMLLENCPYLRDKRVRQEADALNDAGYRVTIIAPKGQPGQPFHETVNGVDVYRFPQVPEANGLLGYLLEYGYAMAAVFVISLFVFFRTGFDIVHAHNPPDTFFLIAAFFKLLGKKFVFDHHDLAPDLYCARFEGKGNGSVQRILLGLEKLSCKFADHVITVNQSHKALEMERDGVPEAKITIVRNGPDLHRVRLVDPDPELSQKAGTLVGYIGTMGFQDGLDYLLRALHHLVYDLGRTEFYCVLIGDGDALSELEDLASELGLEPYTWFTGWLSSTEFLPYLSAVDICVVPDPSNPYNDRSTMIKVMEYMALGKPTVAFDLPEHRFTAQQAALYVKPNDEREFARALAQLIDDPERRQAMGMYGRERVATELSWTHSAQNLLKAYQALHSKGQAALKGQGDTREPV